MWLRTFGRFAAMLLAALVALAALVQPAAAASVPAIGAQKSSSPASQTHCIAYQERLAPYDPAALPALAWDCSGARYRLAPERALLRFELDQSGEMPKYFISRRSSLAGIHLTVIDADGAMRSRHYRESEQQSAAVGGFFKVPLPPVTASSRFVVAAIDLPTQRITLAQAHLAPRDPGDSPAGRRLLLALSFLCGMLAMPLIFNPAFYRVLRESFVLWHAAMAGTILLTILLTSGLYVEIWEVGAQPVNLAMTLVFGASVSAGAMFAATYLEPDKLDPRLRQLLILAAIWSMAISTLRTAFPFALRAHQADIYYLCYIPILVLFVWVMADAWRRGSRAVRFQVVGWTPLLVVGLARLVSQLTPLLPPTDAMMLFYIGAVFEILATTMGVADRFMAIKRERDSARTEAHLLERISQRDPLTGLFNRRAIEERFQVHRMAGYTTLAVLDLDHFKAINDIHGHGVGDRVLQVVGATLMQDGDMLAYRMGGEEFLLLLKGRDALQRAENRRQSIALRVAQEMPGLDRPVTASMGAIEIPNEVMPGARFDELYARADRLLYEAKEGGRNRMVSERMQAFDRRKGDRRRAAAAC